MSTSKIVQIHAPIDAGIDCLFRSLPVSGEGTVMAAEVVRALEAAGICRSDGRMRSTYANFLELGCDAPVDRSHFAKLLAPDEISFVTRALSGHLVIPDFGTFRNRLIGQFDACREERGGEVASYIPQLARVDPEIYGLGLCTVDGQQASVGDDKEQFCVQSTCKPINYAIAHDLLGGALHQHVGREPSGQSFNELTLNPQGLPHNPMINSGAIMCASLIKPEWTLADRFDFMMQRWRSLTGGRPAAFDNAVYLSEKATADRNFALAYFMRENKAFPPDTDLIQTLDFYFQCCSITVDVRQLSVVAATLANGGICPLTNERIFKAESVKNCLSLMYSSGMYDFSGEFAFSVGIPAKSGVSGALMLVIPGVCGIGVWSPRLDTHGNSVRGVQFAKRLVETFSFHTYANMVDEKALTDPTITEVNWQADASNYLCAAAARGDLSELRRLIASGIDIGRADYDGRTAMHLAASEGREGALRLLIGAGGALEPRDRWGNTPLDDARREGKKEIVALLKRHLNRPAVTDEAS